MDEVSYEVDKLDDTTAAITKTETFVSIEHISLDELQEEKQALKNQRQAYTANINERIAKIDARIALVRSKGVKSSDELDVK